MRELLAEKLLVKIMEWTPEEISAERPLIQALASIKYDQYQQFSPGTRFVESLAKWLCQFEMNEEKRIAYDFVKSKLIFISNEQIQHLVATAYTETINPILIEKSASALRVNKHLVNQIVNSAQYANTKRESLFIGLSDGSRIDQLRRAGVLNNEQVLVTYETSELKVTDMLTELSNIGKEKFNTVFLIDDFTASGTSYFKKNEEGEWKGKIPKVLKNVFDHEEEDAKGIGRLVDKEKELDVHLLFYIATQEAIDNINIGIAAWKAEHSDSSVKIHLHMVQVIDNTGKEAIIKDVRLMELLKKYFDNEIVTSHYKKGKHDQPYLGFNECGLAVVLNHNTPNNSLPILWFPDDENVKVKGLFPRVTRHRDD